MALFALFVPDIPNNVAIQLKRQAFITSKIPDEQRLAHVRSAGQRNLDIKGRDDRPPAKEKIVIPRYSIC
ncbi:unnamed protein product [Ectocarpus sp. 12 AP-2014]